LLTEGKGALIPSIADNTVKRFKSLNKQSMRNTTPYEGKEKRKGKKRMKNLRLQV
jgi:hypothetical protein